MYSFVYVFYQKLVYKKWLFVILLLTLELEINSEYLKNFAFHNIGKL
jgi:hypothetical protein